MEVVGARLGRSSARYGTAAVFSGPVRKWKKSWVPHPASGDGVSHLILYKWTPIPPSQVKNPTSAAAAAEAEPPKKKYKYIPDMVGDSSGDPIIAALSRLLPVSTTEERMRQAAMKSDDENPSDADPSRQPASMDGSDEKINVNDDTMEVQALEKDQAPANGTRGSNLDLSLGIKSRDGKCGSDRSKQ